jgi:hypothetical protein
MSYRVSHRISALALAIFAMVNAEDIISFPISIKESNGNRRIDASTHGYLQGARRRLQEISPAAFPVYQEYGAYYVDIHVGSPPQRQTVLVDTGSENTGIPCTGCDNCGYHTDPNFNQILSESFRHLNCSDCMKGLCNANNDTCTVRSYYAEKSGWRGNEVEDSVSISPFAGEINSDKFRLKFTCMKENDGEFKKQVSNGIMGMNLDKTAFWSQMYDQGIIKSRKFSLCLNTHPLAKHMIGALTLGGVDERLGHRASDMSYMDFTDSSSLFQVQIRKVYIYPNSGKRSKVVDGKIDFTKNDTVALIASKDLFNDGGVKLDSGTTGTLMTPKVKEAFVEAWEKATGKNFPFGPIYLTPGELKTWPTIIFQMEGTQKIKTNSKSEEQKKLVFDENFPDDLLVALPPSHYMQLNLGSGLYSPILKFDGNHGEGRCVTDFTCDQKLKYLICTRNSNCFF